MIYEWLIRPLLFQFDAEVAHRIAINTLRVMGEEPIKGFVKEITDIPNRTCLWGVPFPNPIGMAAGFDKDGECLHGIEALGFGFVEVGTVVPKPQAGNKKPRLFRLKEDLSVINRYGFNSLGVEALAMRLQQMKPLGIPLGISLGKNKDTPEDRAHEDYVYGAERLSQFATYIAINVSSPNTAGLRLLQRQEGLERIVHSTMMAIRRVSSCKRRPMLLVKISPNLSETELLEVMNVVEASADGYIACNTTTARMTPLRSKHRNESGGLSGPRLLPRTVEVVRFIRARSKLPIIGSGGVQSGEDARKVLDAGANLVQIYTGLVYEGPFLPRRINNFLRG